MRSFEQWTRDLSESISNPEQEPEEHDLPEGLFWNENTKLYAADCVVCGMFTDFECDLEDFDPDMIYCGRSPHCCP